MYIHRREKEKTKTSNENLKIKEAENSDLRQQLQQKRDALDELMGRKECLVAQLAARRSRQSGVVDHLIE